MPTPKRPTPVAHRVRHIPADPGAHCGRRLPARAPTTPGAHGGRRPPAHLPADPGAHCGRRPPAHLPVGPGGAVGGVRSSVPGALLEALR